MSETPAPPVSARVLAVERLLRVEADGAFVARLGAARRGAGRVDAETARAASDYVAGVTRQKRWLDFLLGHYVRGGLGALDLELLQTLRVGAYDLVVRGTAPHAAVNEAVETARALLHRGAGGLANAVLRALARALRDGALPEPATGDLADDLAVRHSHPTWMVRRWLAAWGEEATARFLASNNEPPRFALRATGQPQPDGPQPDGPGGVDALAERLTDLGAEPERSRWLDDFVTVGRLQPVLRAGLLAEGACAVQDEAAGLVVRVLDPQPGEAVLDGAAAPGGKAVYAAQRMAAGGETSGGAGRLVALDVSEAKTALVAEAARAQGVADLVETVVADLTAWAPPRPFDRVLLDAPCSGTGVLAKRADLRWNRSPEDLRELAALQDRLLDAAARAVRPGGLLVYSTCSVEAEENDDRVGAFLARHANFSLEPVGDLVPEPMRDGGVYRALPHVHGTDGAFAARLRRAR
ncbi:transcription antitermination factor NusB [Rubrivirga sp. S365]|uniref:transcription antitermination factor NusB n=1 Tax=Rubrivirga sp. S365 TaxID=3076080 RepID=UPI0028CAFCF3|nr:transcription antitermination factor NusB [Rubrivirga sp. S365]MDT7857073.1 transcription antitermination factor NusB [Rubrivirga sp. S365]